MPKLSRSLWKLIDNRNRTGHVSKARESGNPNNLESASEIKREQTEIYQQLSLPDFPFVCRVALPPETAEYSIV
ncbi:hypothetical protein T265_15802, partial [Opisthorchis viverrini]